MKLDYDFVLDHAHWPAFVVDDSAVIRRANPSAVQLLGGVMGVESSLASSIWSPENDLTPEEFLARSGRSSIPSTPLKFRVRGGVTTDFCTHVCAFVREDRKFFLFQLFPVGGETAGGERRTSPGAEGAIAGAASAPEPGGLTAEAALTQRQKLECALQLTRTVANDFNNVLTGILGHVSLILGKLEPSHHCRNSLVEIEKSAQRAAEITHSLAEFSRPEKDLQRAKPGNLNRVVRHSVQLFQKPEAGEIEWNLQLEQHPFTVHGDEAKLQQAFVRLLENAVEAVGSRGQIIVRTMNHTFNDPVISQSVQLEAGNYVSLEVSDSGPGIPPAVLPRVFEPFFTTKSPPHRGLGLAWVYGIVTNHSGVVAVTSPTGQGTTARIFLPAQGQIVKDLPTQFSNLRGHETVLVVDDEALLLNMCQTVLSSFGYRVLLASNAAQALDMVSAAKREIDLVITDLVMPGMSGRDLVDRLRDLAPEIPVLCMSGYATGDQEEATGHYLGKPFATSELLSKVREVLHPGQGS